LLKELKIFAILFGFCCNTSYKLMKKQFSIISFMTLEGLSLEIGLLLNFGRIQAPTQEEIVPSC